MRETKRLFPWKSPVARCCLFIKTPEAVRWVGQRCWWMGFSADSLSIILTVSNSPPKGGSISSNRSISAILCMVSAARNRLRMQSAITLCPRGDETKGECYDSLVRKILSAGNSPAVILLFAVFSDDWNLQGFPICRSDLASSFP